MTGTLMIGRPQENWNTFFFVTGEYISDYQGILMSVELLREVLRVVICSLFHKFASGMSSQGNSALF